MNTKEKIEKMFEICADFSIPSDFDVVEKTPYLPWVPDIWNGILVLAESQNLSKNNSDYVNEISGWSVAKKIRRLYNSGKVDNLGVEPWDDGSLKLAVEAAFNEDVNRTSVSNSVMWSQVSETNANDTPSSKLIMASADLWSKLLPVLKPKCIITSGNVAHQVILYVNKKISFPSDLFKLRLPSKTAMSRISGMFNQEDLLKRYPEVKKSIERHPEWLDKFRLNKIYFACHAVSLHGKKY